MIDPYQVLTFAWRELTREFSLDACDVSQRKPRGGRDQFAIAIRGRLK